MSAEPASNHAVSKAVVPAAGLGTRFLPATEATPEGMLTGLDSRAWLPEFVGTAT